MMIEQTTPGVVSPAAQEPAPARAPWQPMTLQCLGNIGDLLQGPGKVSPIPVDFDNKKT